MAYKYEKYNLPAGLACESGANWDESCADYLYSDEGEVAKADRRSFSSWAELVEHPEACDCPGCIRKRREI